MIPKLMHQIWVGPKPRPDKWLQTWQDKHPGWTYKIWDNKDFNAQWKNKRHMQFYAAKGKWNGVADLMRYEILYRYGGILVAADSICLNPVDELFENDYKLYTINTGEYEGGPNLARNRGSVTPLYAAAPGQWFTERLVDDLYLTRNLYSPVRSTGNRFMQKQLWAYKPRIKIWPMHLFISDHFNGWKYKGKDKIFARHFWGTTKNTYEQGL